MTPAELKKKVMSLYQTRTVAEIARLCECSVCRVRQLAKRIGVKCKTALGHIEQHHTKIVELSKTKTPAQIAKIIGITRVQMYSYNQIHGIVCKKAISASLHHYESSCMKALTNGPSELECILNDIRRANYSPVYAENTTNGTVVYFTGRYIIGNNLILDNYEAVQKFAAQL